MVKHYKVQKISAKRIGISKGFNETVSVNVRFRYGSRPETKFELGIKGNTN